MLRDKLSRFADQLAKTEKDKREIPLERRYRTAADSLKGEILVTGQGNFILKTTDFGPTYAHGEAAIFETDRAADFHLINDYFHGCDGVIDSSRLLFLDTETTGLGGTGTVAFLVGCGSITPDGFQVRQYFLPDYPDEAALLEAVREEIKPETILVTYNGKSFDMPILKDRLVLNRVVRELEIGGHIDLLHLTRRLYRKRLGSCTLGNIEREILDFHRQGDIPGELVPSIYFNWLNTESTEYLAEVLEHNLNDIVSLYFLLHRINKTMENPSVHLTDPDDLYSLARIFEIRREHEKVYGVIESCRPVIAEGDRRDILFMQALAYKRAGRYAEALPIWESLAVQETGEALAAVLEMAKYYEHKARDYAQALNLAQKAGELAACRPAANGEVQKRINRLRKRLAL